MKTQFIFFILLLPLSACNKNDSGPFVDRTDHFNVTNKSGIDDISVEINACGNRSSSGIIDINEQIKLSCNADFTYTGEIAAVKMGSYNHHWSGSFPADSPAQTYSFELTSSGIIEN